jgi:hypothetical protein
MAAEAEEEREMRKASGERQMGCVEEIRKQEERKKEGKKTRKGKRERKQKGKEKKKKGKIKIWKRELIICF